MSCPPHKQTELRHPSGITVSIDDGIVALIAALWNRGIDTEQSCEEFRPGLAWIAFPTTDDALAFLAAVHLREEDADSDELSLRALGVEFASPDATPALPWEWQWSAQPRPEEGTFGIAVEFPRRDLHEIERRMAQDS